MFIVVSDLYVAYKGCKEREVIVHTHTQIIVYNDILPVWAINVERLLCTYVLFCVHLYTEVIVYKQTQINVCQYFTSLKSVQKVFLV